MCCFFQRIQRIFSKFLYSVVYAEVYKLVFGTKPFPFWFIVNCLWGCHIVHLSQRRRKLISRFVINYVISFCVVFVSRELYAFVMRKPSPIASNPISLLIHLACVILYEVSPRSLFYKCASVGEYFLGMFEGMYQMRTLCFGLRNISLMRGFGAFILSVIWTTLDQMVMFVLRMISRGTASRVSGFWYWLRSVAIFTCYWMLTHENKWSKIFGTWPVMRMALLFCLIQGISNTVALVTSGCRKLKTD